MNVADLIKNLEKADPAAPVLFSVESTLCEEHTYEVKDIIFHKNTVRLLAFPPTRVNFILEVGLLRSPNGK